MEDEYNHTVEQLKRAWNEDRMLIVQPFIIGSLLALIYHFVGELYL